MKIDTIVAALAAIPAGTLSDWRLVSTEKTARQRFYIGKCLDQKRAIDVTECKLTVYSDSSENGTAYRGEATVTLHPSDTPEEMNRILVHAAFSASTSRTPHFDLPGPSDTRTPILVSGFESGMGTEKGTDIFESHMDTLAGALFAPDRGSAPGTSTVEAAAAPRINSLELFLTRKVTRIVNSRGIDLSFLQWQGDCEFIVQADGPSGSVELYKSFGFSEPDTARLSEETASYLGLVADRALAIPMPALADIPVILRGESAEAIFGWFHDRARADLVYTKASPFSIGSAIQGDGPVADPLDTAGEAAIPGLPQSAPRDSDGFPLAATPVIRGGKVVALHGPARYASRLGVEASGSLPLFSVSPGSKSLAEILALPHLEAFVFSDFQIDQMSGSFGAEVRLAYWFDGHRRIPVTGGSITGSLMENRASLVRSSERAVSSRSLCPIAALLPSASITGA